MTSHTPRPSPITFFLAGVALLTLFTLAACSGASVSLPQQASAAGLVGDHDNARYSGEPVPDPVVAESASVETPALPQPSPSGAPVARLVDGKTVASPGFFAPEAPRTTATRP